MEYYINIIYLFSKEKNINNKKQQAYTFKSTGLSVMAIGHGMLL